MPLEIDQFACLEDNYGFLARDVATGRVACIDSPDPEAILDRLRTLGWQLNVVLNTHWHRDHTGGNERLKTATGADIVGPAEIERVCPLDRTVVPGETFALGATRFEVIDTSGHTSQHISYHDPVSCNVFVGDALFALGCGRLFEGTAEQAWSGLSRLAKLPKHTRIHCAHEYTEANAAFALTIDSSPELAARAREVTALRRRGQATVPTTVEVEQRTNPFLRAPLLFPQLPPSEAFAFVRAAKDRFSG